MDMSSTCTNGITIIFLKGRIDFEDKKALQDYIGLALDDEPVHLNLNLQGVPFFDSAIIGLLMLTRNRCKKSHIGFSVSCPQDDVKIEFDTMNLGALIPIYATDQEVIASTESH